jgi:hypothetical protein
MSEREHVDPDAARRDADRKVTALYPGCSSTTPKPSESDPDPQPDTNQPESTEQG